MLKKKEAAQRNGGLNIINNTSILHLCKNMLDKTFYFDTVILCKIEEQCPLNAYKFRFLARSRPFIVMGVSRGVRHETAR